jgi:hypothetical protein
VGSSQAKNPRGVVDSAIPAPSTSLALAALALALAASALALLPAPALAAGETLKIAFTPDGGTILVKDKRVTLVKRPVSPH